MIHMRRHHKWPLISGCLKVDQQVAVTVQFEFQAVLFTNFLHLIAHGVLMIRRRWMSHQSPRELAESSWIHLSAGIVRQRNPQNAVLPELIEIGQTQPDPSPAELIAPFLPANLFVNLDRSSGEIPQTASLQPSE